MEHGISMSIVLRVSKACPNSQRKYQKLDALK